VPNVAIYSFAECNNVVFCSMVAIVLQMAPAL